MSPESAPPAPRSHPPASHCLITIHSDIFTLLRFFSPRRPPSPLLGVGGPPVPSPSRSLSYYLYKRRKMIFLSHYVRLARALMLLAAVRLSPSLSVSVAVVAPPPERGGGGGCLLPPP